jgi:Retrotransposon gag protein
MVPQTRSRSRSTHSHHSMPGSYEGYDEENTVIELGHKSEERGRIPEEYEEQTTQCQKEMVVKEVHWREIMERFGKMKEKNREYRHREEELKDKLLGEQTKFNEEHARNRNLQRELDEARKSERVVPQTMELSRLRVEVATLQQENSNLRRHVTPEAGPAPRSPPPTEQPARRARASFRLPSQRREPEEETNNRTEILESASTPTWDSVVAGWRVRGDHPKKPLSGSKPSEYRPWRYQVDTKFKADSPLYPDDESKISYALSQMTDPIFPAMQEWVIAHDSCQWEDLIREIILYMGLQFQQHDAEQALLSITQKEKETVTQYYHRISTLWNLAQTSEERRIYKFLTSIRPTIGTSLLDRNFSTVSEALNSARVVEERRKGMDANYPRSFVRNKQSVGGAVESVSAQSSPRISRTEPHPNNRFGPVAKKPSGWIGTWYDSENSPRRLTEELKRELTKQGRCWSCRGSGHRGADKVCPRAKRLNSESVKDILAQSESDTESEKE